MQASGVLFIIDFFNLINVDIVRIIINIVITVILLVIMSLPFAAFLPLPRYGRFCPPKILPECVRNGPKISPTEIE